MPYKLKRFRDGEKVVSPGHPNGFSKKPMTHREAVMQLRAIMMKTKGK